MRISSPRTRLWSGSFVGGRKSPRSGRTALARASSKAVTKSSSVWWVGVGDGLIGSRALQKSAEVGADLLQDAFNSSFGPPRARGDLGDLVSLDAQLEHLPL